MAFMEGKLQMIDLIGALQAKRQQEQAEEDRKRKELENEMMELANKANKHKQGLIENITAYKGPGSGLNEPLGWAKYERERNVDKALSAITGNPLPNVGIRGLGGGGGGGPQQDPYSNYAPGQLDQMNAINEYQPQQAKPQAADIATLLGQLYRPGGGEQAPPQAPSLYEKLGEEEGNVAGLNSLLTQAAAKGQLKPGDHSDVLAGASPTTFAADTEMQTWAKGVIDSVSKGNAAKQEALNRGSRAIMSDPRFSMLGKTAEGRGKQKEILANIEEIVSKDRVINLNEVFSRYSVK